MLVLLRKILTSRRSKNNSKKRASAAAEANPKVEAGVLFLLKLRRSGFLAGLEIDRARFLCPLKLSLRLYNLTGASKTLYYYCHLPPFPPTKKEKRDAAYDYVNYWITEKGCPNLSQCRSLLRPWWMGSEGHNFPF